MKNKVLKIVSILSTFAAVAVASSACLFWLHQPKEPKCLR